MSEAEPEFWVCLPVKPAGDVQSRGPGVLSLFVLSEMKLSSSPRGLASSAFSQSSALIN